MLVGICNPDALNIRVFNPKIALKMHILHEGGFFRPFGKKRQSRVANTPERKIRRIVIIKNANPRQLMLPRIC